MKWARMAKDKRAEMGVGTLIIFIAMVLVAAVAASVLINVIDNLQDQATGVAEDTQDYFNTQLRIITVDAKDDGVGYESLWIGAQLATHSGPVDSHGVVLIINDRYFFFNEDLDDEIDVDPDQFRSTYEMVWHKPSGFEGQYIMKAHTVQIILEDDVIQEILDDNEGDKISIRIIPQNGLETKKDFRVPVIIN